MLNINYLMKAVKRDRIHSLQRMQGLYHYCHRAP